MTVLEDVTKAPAEITSRDRYNVTKEYFNLDELLPLDLVRTHTKTDDVPHVTDEQLRLYRKTAFEAALHYSGLLIGPVQTIIQKIEMRRSRIGFGHNRHYHKIYNLKYPISRPQVFTYYGSATGTRMQMNEVGSRNVKVITHDPAMNLESCCAPCGNGSLDEGTANVLYYAGYSCVDDVPAGIILGMLKFIAWSVMRPGDEVLTMRNRTSVEEGGLRGTNNVAWASGALEMWREYDDEAY